MSLSLNKNPGYLYQFSREKSGIDSAIKNSFGIKEKEESLYLYLIPSGSSSCIDPFNNYRLRSVLNEVEVVVFDTPIEEKSSLEANVLKFREVLQLNSKEEDLMRINDALNERLKNNPISKVQIEDMGCEDSMKLPNLVVGKVLVLMMQNCKVDRQGSDASESTGVMNDVFQTQIGPKECIYKQAVSAGKIVEYIDERGFLQQNKELLFSKGLLEGLICSLMTDSSFVEDIKLDNEKEVEAWNSGTLHKADHSLIQKNPTFIDFQKKFAHVAAEKQTNDLFTLASKINDCLSSGKKTLLVLQEDPSNIKILKCTVAVLNSNAPLIKEKRLFEPTGCFWKVKKDNVTVGYLLGSIHLTPEYLLDLNSRIRKCFQKSARLAVELDVTGKGSQERSADREQKWMREKLNDFSADQVENILSALQKLFPEDSSRFDLKCDEGKAGFISCGLSKLKSKIFAELGLYSGIDLHLIDQAKKEDKPVESLETIEQYAKQETTQQALAKDQIKDLFLEILSSAASTKEEGLTETCNFFIEQISLSIAEELNPMFEAWVEGNLEEFAEKEQSMDKKMDMTERNLNIAKKMVSLFKETGRTFSCVGAGHTVGDMSVLSFLNQVGLTTERVVV